MVDLAPQVPRPESVVIVLLSAIGDVVHGMPIATSLRRAWPDTRIHWVIQPVGHGLVAPHPAVDEFHLFDRKAGLKGFADLRRQLGGRRFDLAIGLQVYLKAGLIMGMLPADRKLGFDRARARDLNWLFSSERIPPHKPQHVEDQYFEFLDYLGVPVAREWEFAFSESEREKRDRFFEPIDAPALAVVLRTTRPGKNWPLERYARVLEIAQMDLGLQPVLIGSRAPAEAAAAAELLQLTRARPINALENDLRRLAWILDGADYALSPDTGPLHVAVALGTPTVSLYGYTDPKRVGPYRRFSELVIDRYTRPGEVTPSMEFRPGNMELITVDEVAAKLEQAVRSYGD
ncbi:MAG: glycosyltransferase family 9 protein [marine benthic group bacterium]|jgi:heptosyltransferase I|nr:glycosyltransferase family 9 protein [Gemmatimonadota bacterium]MCL7968352.1 glycosyltransferase family 9 protein [Gemmatimonadota bacterium]MCL7983858.1 glycosyltransferase family 9 protein [Gemmatimonadota bacterium]